MAVFIIGYVIMDIVVLSLKGNHQKQQGTGSLHHTWLILFGAVHCKMMAVLAMILI